MVTTTEEQIADIKQSRPKGGKSSKTKVFAYRLSVDLAAILERRAKKMKMSPSAYTAKTMTHYLTRNHHNRISLATVAAAEQEGILLPDSLLATYVSLIGIKGTD